MRSLFNGFTGTLGAGVASVVMGAFLAKTLGFGSAVLLGVLAIALHLLAGIMGNKFMAIVLCYGLGLFLAIRFGWATLSMMPQP